MPLCTFPHFSLTFRAFPFIFAPQKQTNEKSRGRVQRWTCEGVQTEPIIMIHALQAVEIRQGIQLNGTTVGGGEPFIVFVIMQG